MKTNLSRPLAALICLAALLASCTKPYRIDVSLEAPLQQPAAVAIGSIVDQLPAGFEAKDKPSLENINKFKIYLQEELEKSEVFGNVSRADSGARYVVWGALTNYKKGSGVVRALIGFGVGNAYMSTELKLFDTTDGAVLFAGVFKGEVREWLESGDAMFRRIAKDFAKQLKKSHQKQSKGS